METMTKSFQNRAFSIKLWPPSHSTRLMLVERMTRNLSSPSLFSRKYGLLSKEEAEENAKQIEDSAFAVANGHHEEVPDADGSSAVQLYAKECSKLMLEVFKRGSRPKEDGDVLVIHTNFFDLSRGQRGFINAEEVGELLEGFYGLRIVATSLGCIPETSRISPIAGYRGLDA